MMKYLCIFIFFIVVNVMHADTEYDSLLIGEFLETSFWMGGDDIEIDSDIDSDGKKETIILGLDHPNGTRLMIINGEEAFNYGVDIRGIGEYGELMKDYYCQLAIKDMTNDGRPDILLAVGDGLIESHLNIWRCNKRNAAEPAKFEVHIEGQEKFYILPEGKIEIPYGSQALFGETYWNGKKFVGDFIGE